MQFLNPGFLWALLALAIPVVVHLFNLQRTERVVFANNRMLQSIMRETSKARNLRHLLLLALRILAMASIILAFAQPVFTKNDSKSSQGIAAVCTYIDNSPSMSLPDDGGTALDRGIAFAGSIPGKSENIGWFKLMTNSQGLTKHSWTSAAGFRDQVLEVQKTPSSGNLQTNLNRAYRQFSLRNGQERKQLFVISDFQKSQFSEGTQVKLDSTVDHIFVPVGHKDVFNVWIDSAWKAMNVLGTGDRTEIRFKVKTSGIQQAKQTRVQLFEGNNLLAGKQIDIKPGQDLISSLSFKSVKNGIRFRLEIDDIGNPSDNSFYFTIRPRSPLKILVLGQNRNQVLYNLFSSSSDFRIFETSAGNPDYAALETCDLLILNQLKEISQALGSRIKESLESGNAVAILPSSNIENELLVPGIPDAVFNPAPVPVKAVPESKILQPADDNTFFKGTFVEQGRNPGLPSSTQILNLDKNGFPLLRYESGKIFLTKLNVGAGNLYVFAGDASDKNNSFHRHPLMLASFYRMAYLAQKDGSEKLFESRSQDRVFLSPDSAGSAGEGQVELVNGSLKIMAGLGHSGKDLFVQADCRNLAEGFWDVMKGSSNIGTFAVNRHPEESIPEFYGAEALKIILPNKPWIKIQEISSNESAEHLRAGMDSGNSLWKYLLVFGILCLIAEAIFIRKSAKQKSSTS